MLIGSYTRNAFDIHLIAAAPPLVMRGWTTPPALASSVIIAPCQLPLVNLLNHRYTIGFPVIPSAKHNVIDHNCECEPEHDNPIVSHHGSSPHIPNQPQPPTTTTNEPTSQTIFSTNP